MNTPNRATPPTASSNPLAGRLLAAAEELPTKGQKSSIISEGFNCEGSIKSDGLLNLDGSFKGEIHVDELVIGPNGKVIGAVRCRTISVRGHFDGALHCQHISVLNNARVDGRIFYRTLEIASGARVTGEFFRSDAASG